MERLRTLWEKINTGFWFLPSVSVSLSVGLSFVLLFIDSIYVFRIGTSAVGLFGGTADAARVLLSTIAGSLITVISIAFSITIVALQQASTQYSPRVLRSFTRDKGNQAVLGTYLATFIYALLILRSVRAGDSATAEFVPALSITVGLALTLACMGLLIYFISHIASSLQIETIIGRMHHDLVGQIEVLYPDKLGAAAKAEVAGDKLFEELKGVHKTHVVKSPKSGFVRAIDSRPLEGFADQTVPAVFVRAGVGDFVVYGEAVAEISMGRESASARADKLADAIIIDHERSVNQDPLFAIDQLVDIALRALSPGVNDPTTAEYCLFGLTDALCQLASREFPSNQRTFEGGPTVFIFNRPGWREFVDATYSQIRRAAANDVHVTDVLVRQLAKLMLCTAEEERVTVIAEQLLQIKRSVERQDFSEEDISSLNTLITRALTQRRNAQ